MTSYEELLTEAKNGVIIYERNFKSSAKGMYIGSKIGISKSIPTMAEKACILAEELGHYLTSYGNILDQSVASNHKQECRARAWAYERLVTLDKLISAYETGIRNWYELSEFLDVTDEFLREAIKYYKEKYGLYHIIENYIIYFDPLGIYKKFEQNCKGGALYGKD